MSIRIKNWSEFQHYRDRNPPWIKLHRRLLNDREFFSLDGDCVKTLVLLWMLAAETKDGELPSIDDIAWRLHMDSKLLASQIHKLNHWLIVDASTVLADCEHDDSNMVADSLHVAIPETERESETNTENRDKESRSRAKGSRRVYPEDFETFRRQYPGHRHGGKLQDFKSWKEALKNGMTPEVANRYLSMWKSSSKWKEEGGKYVVAISKWLRDGYWDTEPQGMTSDSLYRIATPIRDFGKEDR